MPLQKGHQKFGGRKKGTPNKRTQELVERAEELGVDPFEILLLFAKGAWKALGYKSRDAISPSDRLRAAAEATQYLFPKKKSIEHSGLNGSAIPIEVKSDLKVILSDPEAFAAATLLEKKLNAPKPD